MKLLPATFFAAALLSLMPVRGQEPPLPATTGTPAPGPVVRPQLNIPEIPTTVEPPPLVPLVPNTAGSPVPKKSAPPLSELDAAFQKSSLGQAADEYRLHLEWRQLQNRASLNPEVIAAKAAVETAKTDLEKRDYLRAYYKIFYARMQGLTSAPDVKGYLEAKKKAVLASLEQPRVRPGPAPRSSPRP